MVQPIHAIEETQGRQMRQNLTDITVRQLPHPESGNVKYWDATVPGFGVRVTKGSKSWIVMRGRERRLTTFASYPATSLANARKEAKRLLVQDAPTNAPKRILEANTAYLAEAQTRLRPSTYSEYARYLKLVADKPLSALTRQDIGTSEAHAVMAWKVFCNWCVKHEYLDRNPFQHVPATYQQRSRVLTDDEIKAIWRYNHPPYSDIVKLCLLTGQRVGEVTSFNQSWILVDTITIPSTISKNHKEHTLPFHLLTAQYLQRYFGHSFNGFSKAKKRMDEKTGVTGYTIHDLRRTFSTRHAMIGTPIHVTERLLNHISGSISGVSAVYNRHSYLEEARKAVLDYELHIANLVSAEA